MCGESYHLTTDYYFIQGNKTWHLPFLWHIKWLFLLMNAFAKYMCGITVIKLWQGKLFVSNHHIFVKIRIFQISVWEENRSTWSKPTRSQWESLSLRCDPLSSATPGKWYQVHYFQLQTPTVACENHGVYMYIVHIMGHLIIGQADDWIPYPAFSKSYSNSSNTASICCICHVSTSESSFLLNKMLSAFYVNVFFVLFNI